MYLVRRGQFPWHDKDMTKTHHMIHKLHGSILSIAIQSLQCGKRKFRFLLLLWPWSWPSCTNVTDIPSRRTGICRSKMSFRRQGFQKLLYYRQTDKQTYTQVLLKLYMCRNFRGNSLFLSVFRHICENPCLIHSFIYWSHCLPVSAVCHFHDHLWHITNWPIAYCMISHMWSRFFLFSRVVNILVINNSD